MVHLAASIIDTPTVLSTACRQRSRIRSACAKNILMRALTVMAILLFPSLPAQSKPTQEKPDMKRAVEAWLSSDHDREELMTTASQALLERGKKGIRYLAALVADSAQDEDRFRREALEALVSSVSIGFLQKEASRGMVYAGQFEPLSELQPLVGDLFLELILDTPDWFPEDMRGLVVPALRDIYPTGPDQASIRAMRSIAEDEDHETEALRGALTYALAQWGERDLVEEQISRLREAAGEETDEDQLIFVEKLGRLHYELREYSIAAETWARFLRKMEAIEVIPTPLNYYNAACSLCLSGQPELAFAELEHCAELMRSPDLDSSARVERKLFEEDPELRTIRSTRRFQKLVASIFKGNRAGGA